MKKILIVAETGSDINPEIASKYDIHIVPMHVTFDTITLDDGSFPVENIPQYYKNTGNLPKTSGCNPGDFEVMFEKLHHDYPDAQILYLAYSAVTTCSYQSAKIVSEDLDYIHLLDTKQVSFGQGAIVVEVAKFVNSHPDANIEEVIEYANETISRAKMCFIPDNLDFLRAGGRVSNVAYLGATLLNLHPCIEIIDGKLVATKKYRGKMSRVCAKLLKESFEKYHMDTDLLWLIYTVGLSDEVKESVNQIAYELGFKEVNWVKAGGVITTHGGPAAFGIAGFSAK